MPYVSEAQRRYMNAQRGKKVEAGVVDDFNAASEGLKLPERVKSKKVSGAAPAKKKRRSGKVKAVGTVSRAGTVSRTR